MPPPRPARELRSLLALATPLAAVQLGNQLLGIVDLAVVGRLGENQLAGVGLGAQISFIASVVGFAAQKVVKVIQQLVQSFAVVATATAAADAAVFAVTATTAAAAK